MKNTALEIIDLSKRYGGFCLTGINLTVDRGAILGLIGHNGAGKSTLIKSILGLVKKDSGEIRIPQLTQSVTSEDLRAYCGYVPETLTFYEWMKVERMLDFISAFYSTWDRQLCRGLMGRYELDPDKQIKHLSRGMRTKLALVIALSHRPPVLLLDEPTSGLDPIMKHNFLLELHQVIRDGSTEAVIIASHLLGEIEQVANRIAILKNGSISFDESVSDFLQRWSKITFISPGREPVCLPQRYVISHLNADQQMIVVKDQEIAEVMNYLRYQGAVGISVTPPNLQEVFIQVS